MPSCQMSYWGAENGKGGNASESCYAQRGKTAGDATPQFEIWRIGADASTRNREADVRKNKALIYRKMTEQCRLPETEITNEFPKEINPSLFDGLDVGVFYISNAYRI